MKDGVKCGDEVLLSLLVPLGEIIDLLFGKDSQPGSEQLVYWKGLLFEDKIEEVIEEARELVSLTQWDKKAGEAKIQLP